MKDFSLRAAVLPHYDFCMANVTARKQIAPETSMKESAIHPKQLATEAAPSTPDDTPSTSPSHLDPAVALLHEYFRTTQALIRMLGVSQARTKSSIQKFADFKSLAAAVDFSSLGVAHEGEADYNTAKSRLKHALENGGAPAPIEDGNDARSLIGDDDVLVSIINGEFFKQSFRYRRDYLNEGSLVSQIALKVVKIS